MLSECVDEWSRTEVHFTAQYNYSRIVRSFIIFIMSFRLILHALFTHSLWFRSAVRPVCPWLVLRVWNGQDTVLSWKKNRARNINGSNKKKREHKTNEGEKKNENKTEWIMDIMVLQHFKRIIIIMKGLESIKESKTKIY